MLSKRVKEFSDRAYWLKEGVLYHRGKYSDSVKENTMEAFSLAINDKLGIELDVRLSKDNEVVVIHDGNLKRVYGVDKDVSECSFKELSDYSDGKIPLLKDVLDLVDDRVGLMIEIKSNKVGVLEEKTYEILKNYRGRYVVVSFNPFSLKYFRKRDSSIIRGQLSYSYDGSGYPWLVRVCLRRLWFNFISKPHFISYGIDNCNINFLKKVRKKGYFIIGWTYKNKKNDEILKQIYDNMIVEKIEMRSFKE